MPVAMAAGRSGRERASDHIFPSPSPRQRDQEQGQEDAPLDEKSGSYDNGGDDARNYPRSTVADLRGYAAGEQEGDADSNHRNWVDNIGLENATGRANTLQQLQQQQQPKLDAIQGRAEPAAAAAGKQTSAPVNMGHIMSHVAAKDARAYSATGGRSMGGAPEEYTHNELAQDGDGDNRVEGGRSPAAMALMRDSEMARGVGGGEEETDQAYIHSLAYGNLGSVLPILLDRRSALEVCQGQIRGSTEGIN